MKKLEILIWIAHCMYYKRAKVNFVWSSSSSSLTYEQCCHHITYTTYLWNQTETIRIKRSFLRNAIASSLHTTLMHICESFCNIFQKQCIAKINLFRKSIRTCWIVDRKSAIVRPLKWASIRIAFRISAAKSSGHKRPLCVGHLATADSC